MAEHIRIPTPKEGFSMPNFYGTYWLVPDHGNVFVATGSIHARKRGPEMMHFVINKFQSLANERKITIIHEYEAEHEGAVRLIEQFPEYVFDGKYRNEHPLYIRQYFPQ